MGLYHLGVVKVHHHGSCAVALPLLTRPHCAHALQELLNQGLLPRVVSGSSAGSIVVALLGVKVRCQRRSAALRLRPWAHVLPSSHRRTRSWWTCSAPATCACSSLASTRLPPPPPPPARWPRCGSTSFCCCPRPSTAWPPCCATCCRAGWRAARCWTLACCRCGSVVAARASLSSRHAQRCLREQLGDLTFQEAYDRTGRIINITVTPTNNEDVPTCARGLCAAPGPA